jgi:hypothetical protein
MAGMSFGPWWRLRVDLYVVVMPVCGFFLFGAVNGLG